MVAIYKIDYKSPVRAVKITCDGQFITELVFAEEEADDASEADTSLPCVLKQCTEQLDEFFSGERKEFTIPVKQAGTAFQQRVWNELMQIPFGKTISYLSLAKRLGDAAAIRAVAAGNGKNKVGILVPCHRVVGSNQSLVGYAWGIQRKQWLLQHEARLANGVQTLF